MQVIAVTGAAGFIGAGLCSRLAEEEVDLLLVDHPLTQPKLANWVGLQGFKFMEHLHFLDALEAGRVGVDAVFHLGACSDTTEADWEYLRRNNIEYSQRLWRWCAAHGKCLVYASSAATYGDGSRGFQDTTHPRDLVPLNLYGRSKNDFDLWALDQVERHLPAPPRWAGVKFFNVYGPREAHKGKMASMVWHAYRQIRLGGEVVLFKSNTPEIFDGEQKRDFVYVGDCLDQMLWLWRADHAGGLYNSGTGHARTFLDLVRAVFSALNREVRIRFVDMPADLRGQYQNFTEATMDKLRSTGYAGQHTPIERGVAAYVGWLDSAVEAGRAGNRFFETEERA